MECSQDRFVQFCCKLAVKFGSNVLVDGVHLLSYRSDKRFISRCQFVVVETSRSGYYLINFCCCWICFSNWVKRGVCRGDGSVSLFRKMARHNYDISLATGTVAAAGTIGALIPPSILLILFGIIAEVQSVRSSLVGSGAGLVTAISCVL